jgi:tellurium resistance protein terD
MAISLQKGGKVSLTKEDAGLKNLLIGLGWNVRQTDGVAFDLDASAFCLGANGKVRKETDFVFFKNLQTEDGTVRHGGDNRTGDGDGDDETIHIQLDKVPADVERIAIVVNIYNAAQNGQNFGQVSDAYIRCVNEDTNSEIARFDLTEDASTNTEMIFGEVYRHNGEWRFNAVAQGYNNNWRKLVENYGLEVQ